MKKEMFVRTICQIKGVCDNFLASIKRILDCIRIVLVRYRTLKIKFINCIKIWFYLFRLSGVTADPGWSLNQGPRDPLDCHSGSYGTVDPLISAPDNTLFGIGVQNYIFILGSPQRESNDRPNVKRILDQTLLEQNTFLLLLFTMQPS